MFFFNDDGPQQHGSNYIPNIKKSQGVNSMLVSGQNWWRQLNDKKI